ncbi:MAG: decaprenyl-phosphate phosphoribosyltransferase [candidate division Zixibacteria bacterium]|nr:decaprenyl-phosphate phosphoribosyltransferase [candidate division Zixibacteria bacterium]
MQLKNIATIKDIIFSLRPQQWTKNLLVFAALIFAKQLTDPSSVLDAILTFVSFCLLSSAVYLINDLLDADSDRQHPLKSRRPIAAGKVSQITVITTAIFLVIISELISFGLNIKTGIVSSSFLILGIMYSISLKHFVIIDVISVSLGFVLRAVAGAFAISVEISPWLLTCAFLLAMFLGLGKRRHEIVMLEDEAVIHRKSLANYSTYFLDQLIAVVTASTLVAYCFYTLSPEIEHKLGTRYLSLTIPFVLYGIFRYLFLIHHTKSSGDPTKALLTDAPILINIVLWIASILALVYVW